MKTYECFDGAISFESPVDLVNGSLFRQVPDTQELYLERNGQGSVIVEVLELVHEAKTLEEAGEYHFKSLAHDNETEEYEIQNITVISDSSCVVKGLQTIEKAGVIENIPINLNVLRIAGKYDLVTQFNKLAHTPIHVNDYSLFYLLECTTGRLEDILLDSSLLKQAGSSGSGADTVAGSEPATATATAPPAAPHTPPPAIADFTTLLNTHLSPFTVLSAEIGGEIHSQSQDLESLLQKTLSIVLTPASRSKPPTNLSTFQNSLSPIITHVNKIVQLSDSAPKALQLPLKAVAEGVPAFGWFTIAPKPAPYIQDFKDAAQFYANRVIKEFKGGDERMVQWVKLFMGLLEELRVYVHKHHTTGLSWNEKDGVAYEEYVSGEGGDKSSDATPTNNSTPPPAPAPPAPAPPAPPAPTSTSTHPQSPQQGPEAVFAQLNKGSDITKGLRKVDTEQMTHKNPSLRDAGSTESTPKKQQPPIAAKPKSLTRTTSSHPPKTQLDGQKWFIENHTNTPHILIDDTKLSHTVNIFNCKNTVVEVKGKVNALNMVGCHRTSVLLDNLVSSLSITTSPNFTVQILGVAPTVTVDATDVGQIYLSKGCIEADTEIITAKTSSVNVSLPDNQEDSEFVEKPIPEQLKTVVRDGRLVSSVVEHSG
ncbi:hypothetical protein E3P94_00612 [Wallemia ichthyophaga]|nr:hypothetical protein E3P95_02604 [Wallemia ichthyophaga]TIB04594.1 hypothetical protein E3P94_00612 [Wallemia ichthyophaga]